MGFFDGWVIFKKTTDGKTICYSNIFWGKGFIVPNIKKKQAIERAAKRLNVIFFILMLTIIAGTWVGGNLFISIGRWYIGSFSLALVVCVAIWYQQSLTSATKGLTKSNVKLSISESILTSAFSVSLSFLLFFELISWFIIYRGLFIMNEIANYAWYVRPIGTGVFIFGILLSLAIGYMILLRAKAYFSR